MIDATSVVSRARKLGRPVTPPKNSELTGPLLALVAGVLAALARTSTTGPPLVDPVLAVVSVGLIT